MTLNSEACRRSGLRFAVLVALALPGSAVAEALSFDSPDAAAQAIIAALEASNRDALVAIFGPENEDVILTGEEPRDQEIWSDFLQSWNELHNVTQEAGGRATLYIGADQWPVPAPIVQGADGRWSFDAAAAREEVLNRRIGENELDVIDLLQGYVRAQATFRRTDWDGDGVLSFASDILSSAGVRDGLYWPPVEGMPESPVGDFVARAAASGYSFGGSDVAPEPYLGYYFRMIARQGATAPGGAYDYMVGGRMLAGHAMLAFPAAYGETGVMSFMVTETGVVHDADLGPDTATLALAIDSFDPADIWVPVAAE